MLMQHKEWPGKLHLVLHDLRHHQSLTTTPLLSLLRDLETVSLGTLCLQCDNSLLVCCCLLRHNIPMHSCFRFLGPHDAEPEMRGRGSFLRRKWNYQSPDRYHDSVSANTYGLDPAYQSGTEVDTDGDILPGLFVSQLRHRWQSSLIRTYSDLHLQCLRRLHHPHQPTRQYQPSRRHMATKGRLHLDISRAQYRHPKRLPPNNA